MKEYLKQIVSARRTGLPERGVVREYLQAKILQGVQDSGAFLHWAFHGGTALRFLYSIPRYSEDLDFALAYPERPPRFRETLQHLQSMFAGENYPVEIKVNDRKTVNSAFVRFPGLLYELGVSPHQTEIISVKLELDTTPPRGAGTETTLVRRHVTLNLLHHDKASLLAGKLHAVMSRPYSKGRDLYDLVWYLADPNWPAPNLALLNSALRQTGWTGEEPSLNNWRKLVAARLGELDWGKATADVRPFLENQADLGILTLENCLRLLQNKR